MSFLNIKNMGLKITEGAFLVSGMLYILSLFTSAHNESLLYPLLGIFLPFSVISLILSLFPKEVYRAWLILSVIFSFYIFFATFTSSVEACGFLLCFSRTWVAGELSMYMYGNIFWVSIVIGLMWYFVSKRKENKLKSNIEKEGEKEDGI